jgi:hypothetical protein
MLDGVALEESGHIIGLFGPKKGTSSTETGEDSAATKDLPSVGSQSVASRRNNDLPTM